MRDCTTCVNRHNETPICMACAWMHSKVNPYPHYEGDYVIEDLTSDPNRKFIIKEI